MRGDTLNVRSHLTVLSSLPSALKLGPQPASIVLAHSIAFLPEKPMAGRPADPRVGFVPVECTQFKAAGFSNAIRVVDAPTTALDRDASPENVTINVIRWLPQERVNAMGPRVVNPRSGETLSAHIRVWPQVIDGFGQYYYAMFGGGGDPAAPRLPLSNEKSGALLSQIVAHEVGHTLGLLHNPIASTAHTVAQMRDPAFANR